MYLHLHPEAVDMAQAVDERGYAETEHAWMDWSDGPLKIMPWWSSFSESGVQGDASKATAAKGRALFEAATQEIAAFVTELRACRSQRERTIIDYQGPSTPSRRHDRGPRTGERLPQPQRGPARGGVVEGPRVQGQTRPQHLRAMHTWQALRGRAQDLMDMFTDDEVDVVHCFRAATAPPRPSSTWTSTPSWPTPRPSSGTRT